jgi:hypothetical protein
MRRASSQQIQRMRQQRKNRPQRTLRPRRTPRQIHNQRPPHRPAHRPAQRRKRRLQQPFRAHPLSQPINQPFTNDPRRFRRNIPCRKSRSARSHNQRHFHRIPPQRSNNQIQLIWQNLHHHRTHAGTLQHPHHRWPRKVYLPPFKAAVADRQHHGTRIDWKAPVHPSSVSRSTKYCPRNPLPYLPSKMRK